MILLGVFGYGGYRWWKEATALREANKLLANGGYKNAAELLNSFVDETYLYRSEAQYLLAVALTKEYASASRALRPDDNSLEKPKRILEQLCGGDQQWHQRAASDLGHIIVDAPEKATGDLRRSAAIAILLEQTKLADPKELAKGLLAKLRAWGEKQQEIDGADAAAVGQIVLFDPSVAADVITALLPGSEGIQGDLQPRLALVQRCAHDQPSLAKLLATAMVERATDLARGRQSQMAEQVLDAAEDAFPALCGQCVQKRLGWLKSRLDEKDYAGVMRGIDGMRLSK